jgi:isopentenyl-diphosphate delta-isomerase
MNSQEMLDIVDKNDNVIGIIGRDDYYAADLKPEGYLRAADMFLVNDAGEFWVPKRTSSKKSFPNCLDFSVGGHVSSGEDYFTTILREAEEEINVKLKSKDVVLIDIQRNAKGYFFNALYIYRTNETPDYNPDDFQSAEWLAPKTLLENLDAGVPAKDNIRFAIERISKSGKLKSL